MPASSSISTRSSIRTRPDQELDAHTFSLDADVEAGILAATQEWGDDVMTEGELGELLRATASAVIAGETLGINAPLDSDAPGPSAVAEPEEAPAPPAAAYEEERAVSAEEQPITAAAAEPEPPLHGRASRSKRRRVLRLPARFHRRIACPARRASCPRWSNIRLNAIAQLPAPAETERVQLQEQPRTQRPQHGRCVAGVRRHQSRRFQRFHSAARPASPTSVPIERPIVRIAAAPDGPWRHAQRGRSLHRRVPRRSYCR